MPQETELEGSKQASRTNTETKQDSTEKRFKIVIENISFFTCPPFRSRKETIETNIKYENMMGG